MKKPANTPKAEIDYDEIGNDDSAVVVASQEVHDAIDSGLELKLISIRLPVGLLDDLKFIGDFNEIGYQPLIRNVLKRFVNAEFKQMAIRLSEMEKPPQGQKKTA